MGRKKWWEGLGCLPIALILLIEVSGTRGVGEVGCLFDKAVCTSLEETCYDDAAFGRCIPPYALLDESASYRYNLDPVELEVLRTELEKLVAEKYQWSHPYTQCIMTSTLDSIRYKTPANSFVCQEFEESPIIEDFEPVEEEDDGISPIAVVNFMPSRGHGYGDYANEMYYPPVINEELSDDDDDFTAFELKKFKINRHPTLNFINKEQPDELYELSKRLQAQALRAAEETKMLRARRQNRREALQEAYDDPYPEFTPKIKIFKPKIVNNSFLNRAKTDDLYDFVNFFEGAEAVRNARNYQDTYTYEDDDEEDDGGDSSVDTDDYNEIPYWQLAQDFSGFKRPERLDVKKPGPYFTMNNYAFKDQTLPPDDNEEPPEDKQSSIRKNFVKKELIGGKDISYLSLSHNYENVDMDYAFIKFDKEIRHWIDGELAVKQVAKLLGLEQDDLTGTRVGYKEVTFKVMPNKLDMNATQVAGSLAKIREELEKNINMKMIEAGIGDKIQITVVEFPQQTTYSRLSPNFPDSRSVLGIIVCVVLGATAAASIVLIIIVHRQAKTRRKLAGLATPDPEASKDYQDLCRARMQAKVAPGCSTDKPESPRIISLSRESESNRSSTSSWGGDDPAALSNMDISTGHMVLSYMEDHLKNKDRLDQEWSAICAYSPDPSSTAIATDKANVEKNRQGSAFPYDHSRIVLNDLTNLNNSDYINASTITDHDPRNPAYIATQGPLPQTSADFWQLVWEQGSVVIVMLTRLTEEGHAMCHRYWPEEGSELYHIYEVHLVSEHIWCDDYLVRSFYLKNTRTGETRTVTQFHFLSWPKNGVPQSTKALLEFRRKVNKSYRGRSCPIVVHCSDGAGRTGTYCLIDMVLNRMAKGAKEIDIAAALEHIRDQRPGMVSTKQQFEFVLVAVAEEVHAILKALPVPATNEKNNSASSSSDK